MTLQVELSDLRKKVLSAVLVVFLWPEDELQCVEQVLQFKLRYKICKWNFSTGKKNHTAVTQIFTGN